MRREAFWGAVVLIIFGSVYPNPAAQAAIPIGAIIIIGLALGWAVAQD
jgi:hypothetical protein